MIKQVSSLPIMLLAALVCAQPTAAAAQKIGVNAAVKNDVSIRSEEEVDARIAEIGGDVILRDTITSGEASALQVLLMDETVFTVGPEAEIIVDEFVYDPDTNAGELTASVAKGVFRFMSGGTSSDPDNVEINTPVASLGVRGTIVEAAVGRENIRTLSGMNQRIDGASEDASLIVLRGPGIGNRSMNKDGQIVVSNKVDRVTLSKGNTAVLVRSADEPIEGPFYLPDETFDGFHRTLRTRPRLVQPAHLPPLIKPTGFALDHPPVEPFFDPEIEKILDRPLIEDCSSIEIESPTGITDPALQDGPFDNQFPGTDIIQGTDNIFCYPQYE